MPHAAATDLESVRVRDDAFVAVGGRIEQQCARLGPDCPAGDLDVAGDVAGEAVDGGVHRIA